MKPFSGGMRHEVLGNPSANSPTTVIPLVPALRPVSRHDRVGEHRAVVWNWEKVIPASAIRRIFGISISPPNTSQDPYPMSSHTMYSTFGAPARAAGST